MRKNKKIQYEIDDEIRESKVFCKTATIRRLCAIQNRSDADSSHTTKCFGVVYTHTHTHHAIHYSSECAPCTNKQSTLTKRNTLIHH